MLALAAPADLDAHDTGRWHVERPERVGAALAGVSEAGLDEAVHRLAARRATKDELEGAHTRGYVAWLEAFCSAGGGELDPDTVAVPGSWDTALVAAGAGLACVDALRAGEAEVGFVVARPPGHHALADRAMGFCLLNNVAVAAAALANAGERVLVVDWDVHHGNGTQDIFWDDPRVLYVSTHQWPLYPGTGHVEETGGPKAPGTTVNVPLPGGTTGDVVLAALDEVVAPVVERFAPTWVLVSAGFDAHRDDPLAGLRLTAGDFADMAARVARFAPEPGRLVLLLEGGYELLALQRSVAAVYSVLTGGTYRPEAASSGGPGTEAVARARRVQAELPTS